MARRSPHAAIALVATALAAGAALAAAAGEARSTAGDPVAGKRVFRSSGCGACHTLAAAGAKGRVGPSLDEIKPSAGEVAAVVRKGSGAMPPFAGRLSAKQIADVAAFVARATGGGRKPTRPTTGRGLFRRFCGGCHTLAAAGTTGTRGPDLDDEEPDFEDVLEVMLEGEDEEMPSFRGRLSVAEMAKVARFVSESTGGSDDEDDD